MLQINENSLLEDILKHTVSPEGLLAQAKMPDEKNSTIGPATQEIDLKGDTVHISDEGKALVDAQSQSSLTQNPTGAVKRLSVEETQALQTEIAAQAHAPGQKTLFATSKQGTNITVTHLYNEDTQNNAANAETVASDDYYLNITKKDGSQIKYSFTDNARINENDDGSMYIYFSSTNKTHIYDASGNMTEVDGDLLHGDNTGDDIFINTSGSLVEAGEGDDLIISWAEMPPFQAEPAMTL